ncbi:nucleoside deaminase [Aeromicrobium sp.]|uniref:nucleoside deaminase n=1 Tax=Aeromicrobium sp. TaxID=1871063 RepID=UPI002FCA251E
MITEAELPYLRRCIELAKEALDSGDEPYGSILVSGDGDVLSEDRNREITEGDATLHPEFELARWAARNLNADQRASATVFTSGEHCPMCSAAHGMVGVGRIVFASSSAQLGAWKAELGLAGGSIRSYPIVEIAPSVIVEGPVPGLDEEVHDLIRRHYSEIR